LEKKMGARVTDGVVVSLYATEREQMARAAMEAAREVEFKAEEARKEDARLALFVKRLMGGLPLRRAADRRCEALLIATATPETVSVLQGLLQARKN
jgi:hypothetical protein